MATFKSLVEGIEAFFVNSALALLVSFSQSLGIVLPVSVLPIYLFTSVTCDLFQ